MPLKRVLTELSIAVAEQNTQYLASKELKGPMLYLFSDLYFSCRSPVEQPHITGYLKTLYKQQI